MNIADYKRFDVINGPGMRHSIFVSGCSHHSCEGCFNAVSWNFNYGKPYSKDFEDSVIRDLNIDHVKISGFSILGGEPFDNTEGLLPLVQRIKNECINNNIWIWSGYTFEEICEDDKTKKLLTYCDVLVDGRFIIGQRDLKLKWKGSRNQRIINVQESLKQNEIILYES